jgi:hypothetical protein
MTRNRIFLTLIATSTLTGLTFVSSAAAAPRCVTVSGYYDERDASGADCTSPVGLCIVAQYHGDLTGTLTGQATSVVATADTPTTSVLTFTTTSQFTGRLHARKGTLQIRNAGAFRTAGQGSIVDLQTVVSGTAGLSGATGEIRAAGTYNTATGGRSVYNGTVCLP